MNLPDISHYKPRKLNDYYVVGDVVYVRYNNSYDCFICDLDDWEILKDLCWSKSVKKYPSNVVNNLFFHRVVMDCPEDMEVDHIGGTGTEWDNRKCNLRIVTHGQNNMNKTLQSNNKSGHRGVHWSEERQKWVAQIKVNNKNIPLGRYKTFEEAVKAREEAEEKYFGEYNYKGGR